LVHLQGYACSSEEVKPIQVDKPQQDYYNLVSNEAFGLFSLKYYNDYTSYVKGKGKKSIKHLQPIKKQGSRRKKLEGRNFRRP